MSIRMTVARLGSNKPVSLSYRALEDKRHLARRLGGRKRKSFVLVDSQGKQIGVTLSDREYVLSDLPADGCELHVPPRNTLIRRPRTGFGPVNDSEDVRISNMIRGCTVQLGFSVPA